MDVGLFNKYDSIKRKNRTPSYKALLSIQFSSNFDSNSDSDSVKVTSLKKKKNISLHSTKYGKESQMKKLPQATPQVVNITSSSVASPASITAKMDVYPEALHLLDEKHTMDEEEMSSSRNDSSFFSECSESVVSFDGFPEEDENISTSNQHLGVLHKLKSSSSVDNKSFCRLGSRCDSVSGISDATGPCDRSDLKDKCRQLFGSHHSQKRPFTAGASDKEQPSTATSTVTNKSPLTSTPSKHRESNSLMDLSPPKVQLLAQIESNYPFEKRLHASEKIPSLSLEGKPEVKEVPSAVPKVLKKRPNNSAQAKEKHLNLQNALSDALNFFEETMSDDCEAKENKPIILDKQFSPSPESKVTKKDKGTLSNLGSNTNQIIGKDHKNHATIPDVQEITPAASEPVSSLQDALSDAVDFFKATSFDSENVYGEITEDQVKASCNADLELELKKEINLVDSKFEASYCKNLTVPVCKMYVESTVPRVEIDNNDDSVDEAMFAAAKAALIGSESTYSVLGYGRKSVSQDSALHLAMSDVITYWLTTGQANYNHLQVESEPSGMMANSPGHFSDIDGNKALLEEENISSTVENFKEYIDKDVDGNCCYNNISPLALDGLESVLEHDSDKPSVDPIESVHSFILENSNLMNEISKGSCSGIGTEQDQFVASGRTEIPQADILGAELHNSPAGIYNCSLKLSMDPTAPLPQGALRCLIRKAFCQSPLTRDSSCFSTCYKRYTALISRVEDYEQKRLKEMNLIDISKTTGSDPSLPSNPVALKRKYTKRKHPLAHQQLDPLVSAVTLPPPAERFVEDCVNKVKNHTGKKYDSCLNKKNIISNKMTSVRGRKFSGRFGKDSFDSNEAKLKRSNSCLRPRIPVETYSCLSDHFMMHEEKFVMPYLFGWQREVVYRRTGVPLCDIYYNSPLGEKFRSSAHIARYLRAGGPDQRLKVVHFDFMKVQHNLGEPYEFIRSASLSKGRAGKSTASGRKQRKWHHRSLNLVSDFGFLGFMEDDSSLDFEGFTADDCVQCKRRRLAEEERDSDADGGGLDDNDDSVGSLDSGSSSDGDSGAMDDDDERMGESNVGSGDDADGDKAAKSFSGSQKQLDNHEKLHVNVSNKLNAGRGLFDSSEMVDELHMELYASDVDMKDDSIGPDEGDLQNISQPGNTTAETVQEKMNITRSDKGAAAAIAETQELMECAPNACDSPEPEVVKFTERKPRLDVEEPKQNIECRYRDADLCAVNDEKPKNDEDNYESDDDHREQGFNESMEESELLFEDFNESLELVKTEMASCDGENTSGVAGDNASEAQDDDNANNVDGANIDGANISVDPTTSDVVHSVRSHEEQAAGKRIPTPKYSQNVNKAVKGLLRSSSLASQSPIHSALPGERPARCSPILESNTLSLPSVSCRASYDGRFLAPEKHHHHQERASSSQKLESLSDSVLDEAEYRRKDGVSTSESFGRSSSGSVTSFSSSERTSIDPITSSSSLSCESNPLLHHSQSVSAVGSVLRLPKTGSTSPPGEGFYQKNVLKCGALLASKRKELLTLPSNDTSTDKCKESVDSRKVDSTPVQKYIFKVEDAKLVAGASNLTHSHGPSNAAPAARVPGKPAVVTKSSGIITFNRNLLFPALSSNRNQMEGDVNKSNAEINMPRHYHHQKQQQQQQLLIKPPFPQPLPKEGDRVVPAASKKIITFKISDLIDTPKTP